MWTHKQRYRLAAEKLLLDRYMAQFRFYSPVVNTYIEGEQQSSVLGRKYTLRLQLPAAFPDQKPSLIVQTPERLVTRDPSVTVNSLGGCHRFHTDTNSPEGRIRICHTMGWDASRTCVQVLLKGIIWIDAYEMYLNTGEPLSTILENYNRNLGGTLPTIPLRIPDGFSIRSFIPTTETLQYVQYRRLQ